MSSKSRSESFVGLTWVLSGSKVLAAVVSWGVPPATASAGSNVTQLRCSCGTLNRALDVHEVHGERLRGFGSQLEPNVAGLAPHQVFATGHQILDPALAAV